MPDLRSLTTSEVSQLSGIPKRTLENLRLSGQGPAWIRLGKLRGIRFLEVDVVACVVSSRCSTEPTAHTSAMNDKAA